MDFRNLVMIYLEESMEIDIFCSIFVVLVICHIPGTIIKEQCGLIPLLLLLSKKSGGHRARLGVIRSCLSMYISLMFPFTEWLNILLYINNGKYNVK